MLLLGFSLDCVSVFDLSPIHFYCRNKTTNNSVFSLCLVVSIYYEWKKSILIWNVG